MSEYVPMSSVVETILRRELLDAREQIATLQRERDEARAGLGACHNARTREWIEYANLCAEIVDASGVNSGGGITAVEAMQNIRARLTERDAEVARLLPLVDCLRNLIESDYAGRSGIYQNWRQIHADCVSALPLASTVTEKP